MTGSTFTNNQALGSGTGDFGIGGALENNAGLSGTNASTATITGSVFTGNQSGGSTGVGGNGAGIDNEGTGAMMTLSNSTLIGNTTGGGAAAFGVGGGLMNYSGSLCQIVNCTLTGNRLPAAG